MKEVKERFILRHESGLFLSWSPDSMPHTKRISQARRFISTEEISFFLEHSHYRPEHPEEYEIVEIEIEYRLKEGGDVGKTVGEEVSRSNATSEIHSEDRL